MPVNSRDLIASANGAQATAVCEADWRGVCSRAYYSIYQDGAAFHDALPTPGMLTPDSEGGRHADLIDRLIHPGLKRSDPNYTKSVSVGYMMQTVYANRIKSDYRREKTIDKATAQNSIELIAKISEKLGHPTTSPDISGGQSLQQSQTPKPAATVSPAQTSSGRPALSRIK
jgi:hypothetical protein